MKKTIQVIHTESGEVIGEIGVSNRSDREIEKIRNGMEINMSDSFHTCVVRVLDEHHKQQGE